MCYFSLFQVAWLRVDTQTILTIAGHVITKNHRISLTQADRRAWKLHVRELREADRGWYMCQINTEPMLSQLAYLQVVGKYKKNNLLTYLLCHLLGQVRLSYSECALLVKIYV